MTNFDRVVGLMGASVVAIACASPAMAQTRTYSIPAQNAAGGVAALARQSDQQVLISARDAKGKRTREVRGEMTIEQAFAKLLAGSGLTAKRTGAGAWAVVQGGNGDAAPARTEASASGSNVVAAPSASASTVVDARTGAALKGALVEIVETGERTSTGDLGEFRFPGKSGSFNLRISYLGYPQYEQFVDLKDGRATSGILLSDGSASSEIIVTAYQSARAQAINQERTANNVSTVVSSDLLGQFEGTTISESLRRTPGIAFIPDTQTGDGKNIIIRGMSPDFNTISLNGLRIASTDGIQRSTDLGNVLADSISKITVNKTLLPSHDGSGTGGLVEIETKAPLDRPDRFFSINAERGIAAKSFLDEFSGGATASFRFGSEKNFGVSASIQYRKKDTTIIGFTASPRVPTYLPLGPDGPLDADFYIDPRTKFPFEPGVDGGYNSEIGSTYADSSVRNLALTLSAQWKVGDSTDLRLDYNRNELDTKDFTSSVTFSARTAYRLLPVDSLNGEERYVRVWEDSSLFQPGMRASINRTASSTPRSTVNDSLSFRGKTELGPWSFDYKLGYATGRDRTNNRFSLFLTGNNITFTRDLLNGDIASNTVAGLIVSPFYPATSGGISLPGFTNEGFALLNDTSSSLFSGANLSSQFGTNKRKTASLDIRRDFTSTVLKNIAAGVFYEDSKNYSDLLRSADAFSAASLSELGLTFSDGILRKVGLDQGFSHLDPQSVRRFRDAILSGSNPNIQVTDLPIDLDDFDHQDSATERDLALYLQSELQFGKLNIVGGARWESVRTISVANFAPLIVNPDGSLDVAASRNFQKLVNLRGTDSTFLPRVSVNYRFNDSVVLRAGYYSTIARPSLTQLSDAVGLYLDLQPFYGPAGNQPQLNIGQGNPDLKASLTDNYDVSFEWYFDDIGALKVGAFYKRTKFPIFSNVTEIREGVPAGIELPDDPRFETPNLYTTYSIPANSDIPTRLWGIELSIEKRLTFLPGALAGLGVFANYTYTNGKQMVRLPYFLAPEGYVDINIPYNSQAPHSGTAALTYSKYGIDATLSYTIQSQFATGVPVFNLASHRASISTLDFKAQYTTSLMGSDVRLYVEGANLLKGPRDAGVRSYLGGSGSPDFATNARYFGGRSIRIGLSATF